MFVSGETCGMTIHPKVAAASLAASSTVILVWLAGLAGVEVPAEVASAITALTAAGAGYMRSAS